MSSTELHSPSRLRKALVATAIVLAGAGAATGIRFSGKKSATTLGDAAGSEPPVVVALAREAPLRATATIAGRLEARRTVDLAAETAGRLVEVRADVGAALEAGSVAFRLDDRDAGLDVENRRARLAAAEARGRQAERQAERRRRLGQAGVSSPELVEQAALDDDVARAEAAVARKELQLSERELEKTAVTAPWTGTVVARHADPGAWVVPGQAVLRLVDLSKVDVRVDLPASDAVHLRPGDAVRVRFPALPGEAFDGRVRFVASEASAGDHQFPAEIELEGDGRLSAGMIAEIELGFERAGTGVTVPVDAVERDARGPFVWLVDGGRVRRRDVIVAGARAGRSVVSSGLADGDRVVVAVAVPLADGLAIGEVSEAPER